MRHSFTHTNQLNLLSLLKKFNKHWYKGEKVRCNICENNFRFFLPFRPGVRKNAVCPVCRSTEADRVLWFYLTNEVLGKKNKRKFLYFSPHPVILKKMQGYDIDPEIATKDYFILHQFENKEKRLKGGVYDVIIFSRQLEFLDDDELVLAELRRLLRTGGFVVLQTIVNPEMDRTYEHIVNDEDRDRLKQYFEPGVVSIYGVNFHKHLAKAGFKVEVIDFAHRLGEGAIDYYRLGNGVRETIYKCKKP